MMNIWFIHILLDCHLLEAFICWWKSNGPIRRYNLTLHVIYIFTLNFNILALKSFTVRRWFGRNIYLLPVVIYAFWDCCIERQIVLFMFGSHRPASHLILIAIPIEFKLARVLVVFIWWNILMWNHLCE